MSIIAIMSTIVLASVSMARQKARNAQQKTDLKSVALALQSYYIDNSSYPSTGGAWYSSEAGDAVSNNEGVYIPNLAPSYIPALPRSRGGPVSAAPACSGAKNAYRYRSDGTNYKLMIYCGPEGTWTSSDEYYDPVYSSYAWSVCSRSSVCASW